ncbi:unnamed protein product [Protopolystoma xenopodis]|uniref:Uncharacterized protein n=1 Tax=Protopolystoma xenopodis TaxID=117903 RepID=A0A3S5CQD9_9PLAT|nr:unnamed protein product [Protopolystoma xenopodis]
MQRAIIKFASCPRLVRIVKDQGRQHDAASGQHDAVGLLKLDFTQLAIDGLIYRTRGVSSSHACFQGKIDRVHSLNDVALEMRQTSSSQPASTCHLPVAKAAKRHAISFFSLSRQHKFCAFFNKLLIIWSSLIASSTQFTRQPVKSTA